MYVFNAWSSIMSGSFEEQHRPGIISAVVE